MKQRVPPKFAAVPEQVFTVSEGLKDAANPFGHLPNLKPNIPIHAVTGKEAIINFKNLLETRNSPAPQQNTTVECLPGDKGEGIADCDLTLKNDRITLKLTRGWRVDKYGKLCDIVVSENPTEDAKDSCLALMSGINISEETKPGQIPYPTGRKTKFTFTDIVPNSENPEVPIDPKNVLIQIRNVKNPGEYYEIHINQFIKAFLLSAEYQKPTTLKDAYENAKCAVPAALVAFAAALLIILLHEGPQATATYASKLWHKLRRH